MSQVNPYGDRVDLNENIVCLVARDPKELQEKLNNINGNMQVLSIYGMNNRHYAWLLPTHKVKIVKKTRSK